MQEKNTLLFDILSYGEKDTEAAGARLGELLAKDMTGKSSFVALYGDFGAGKTAFVRGMASVLAPEAHVTSPTYSIVNEYPGAMHPCAPRPFRHLDLYRITGEEDLFSVGFFDFVQEGIVAAEWCENIPDFLSLPLPRFTVRISKIGEQERRITVENIFSA